MAGGTRGAQLLAAAPPQCALLPLPRPPSLRGQGGDKRMRHRACGVPGREGQDVARERTAEAGRAS